MWLGCQSRRFNCLFWRETRQRILGQKNLAVSGSGKGTRTRVDDATQERSWWLESREKAVETGQERGEQRGWRGSTEGQSTPDTGTERRGDKIGSSEEESQDV